MSGEQTVLLAAIQVPSPRHSADGQGNYLSAVIPALVANGGWEIEAVALRFGDQAAYEEGPGWRIHRIEPPEPLADVFAAYEPAHFRRAVKALALGVIRHADTLRNPVFWGHGYEVGAAAQALASSGIGVIAVVHYCVAQETVHDLAVGDDPVRAAAFDSPIAAAVGRITPVSQRPRLVQLSSRTAQWTQRLPLPAAVRTQMHKLALERTLLASADRIMAVGQCFSESLGELYPWAAAKVSWCHAGHSALTPAAQWPLKEHKDHLRVCMVGRPTGQKGWDYAVAALAEIDRTHRDAHKLQVVHAGGLGTWSGPYSAYSERVGAALNDLKRVEAFNVGPVAHQQALALMEGADLLLAPSVFEPFGLVLVEAMASGCLVLASDADGPRDLIKPPWGRLIPFADPATRVDGIRDALEWAMALSVVDRSQRQEAARLAARGHDWDGCAAAHASALSACVASSADGH